MRSSDPIPDITLQTLARTFFARGQEYGFGFEDYVTFVNVLLDVAMKADDHAPLAPDPGPLPLRGQAVGIRALEPADRPLFERWLAEESGRYFLLSRSTGELHDLDDIFEDPRNEVGVITTAAGAPVGAVLYLAHDERQHKAELRKMVGEPSLRGQGLGTEATRLWVGYGIRTVGLRKIYLYTLASNILNISLNESLGFRVEGILRNEVLIDGAYHDLLRMGLVVPGAPEAAG